MDPYYENLYKKLNLEYYEIPIGDCFILNGKEKLGFGSSGDVYLGREIKTNNLVAIKLEQINKETIFNEIEIYRNLEGVQRIPRLIWAGIQGNYNILVMNLLGPSLKQLMEKCGGKFSLATTLKVSTQILLTLKDIHSKGIVLRYLKPGNFVIGRDNFKDNIYLIDFGLAKKYIKQGLHIPFKQHSHFLGNPDYLSINAQSGGEISRRDDLESLGYNLILFLKGELPWSKIKRRSKIISEKQNTSLDELCKDVPEEFKLFINYARMLNFYDEPNYMYFYNLLIIVAEKNHFNLNNIEYDWVNIDKNKNNIQNDINQKKEDEKIKNEIEGNEIKESLESKINNIKIEDDKKVEDDKVVDNNEKENSEIKKNETKDKIILENDNDNSNKINENEIIIKKDNEEMVKKEDNIEEKDVNQEKEQKKLKNEINSKEENEPKDENQKNED